jgi:hypothetical protein
MPLRRSPSEGGQAAVAGRKLFANFTIEIRIERLALVVLEREKDLYQVHVDPCSLEG